MIPVYIQGLLDSVPSVFYEGAACILVACFTILVAFKGFKMGFRYTSIILLVEYVILIYCSTVFYRNMQAKRKFDFHPFWTYKAILNGKHEFVAELIMNVVVFIPIGFLLGYSIPSMTWRKTLLIVCLLSVGIEVLQFFFMRGFSELDDVMHNTLGCMIGYGIFAMVRYGYKGLFKRSLGVL